MDLVYICHTDGRIDPAEFARLCVIAVDVTAFRGC